MASNYFDTIKGVSAFKKKRPKNSKTLSELESLPAGSNWSTAELYAARLVVREDKNKQSRLLPALAPYLDHAARDYSPLRRLVEGPGKLDPLAPETELVHIHGDTLGHLWAALNKLANASGVSDSAVAVGVGDMPPDVEDDEKRPYSPVPEEAAYPSANTRSKRRKRQTDAQELAPSSTTQSGTSSPSQRDGSSSESEWSQGTKTDYIGKEHASVDNELEQATVDIASLFIRYVLRNCPPQANMTKHKPAYLVEFSGCAKQRLGTMGSGGTIRATADAELTVSKLDKGHYNLVKMHLPALLEAKKRFPIDHGEPKTTDQVLGQMTCEALALRLELQAPGHPGTEE
ncbi:uncharacterized protein THITE_2040462 [Thermothielavioides terrestris NRRL 8126]|uniref:Uncharacterized protein n=1 Tax=Thermothielavioides terrestris (strain ATCC 38088 / NRRL 8126) TaxID=578455 RepID=G2QXN8_THETT|nr:uncharacterized protein THITE_2040462 [Thermothielavioides terrestris NRRL 8126]AEO62356.1 hypothetical protein THITE_2040462 [Thermothielavioides terrestris NRRL 8126]